MSISMDFDTFTAAIVKDLKKRTGENCQLYVDKVRKNNGVELTGIIIKRKEYNASPTIYIDDYYEEYQRGADYGGILRRIMGVLRDVEIKNTVDLSGFLHYVTASSRIVFKLINYEKNRELLSEIPYKLFHNLAIVFYYIMTEPPFGGSASILIYHSHMMRWGVDSEELFRRAMKNTPHLLPAQIEDLDDLMLGMLESTDENEWISELKQELTSEKSRIPMYVLTNRQKLLGAACMLYPHVIKNFAEKIGNDLYILPSSVHEVILLPFSEYISKESLIEMVTEINRTQVEKYDVLADSLYCYRRDKEQIEQIM